MPADRLLPPPDWLETVNRLATVAAQLASAAHEANNLLQVASGSAEMIEMMPDDPATVVRRAGIIRDHAQRAAELLAAVLDFSRDESVDMERIDLGRLVDRALALRKYVLGKRGIAVKVSRDERTPTALANKRRTLQILLNLLMNAERAVLSAPGPAITIGVRPDGDGVALSVTDNGRGGAHAIDADEFHVEPSGRDTPRLGLGLRVSEWLAAAQDGRLTIAEGEGGTTVTLWLRAATR
jgi:C4-dicarboxylate-specific signal transduction histidine kinase